MDMLVQSKMSVKFCLLKLDFWLPLKFGHDLLWGTSNL